MSFVSEIKQKGAIHICTNNTNITQNVIQKLYNKHCTAQQTIQKGVCSIDVNRQFILLGSDEYINAIFDPQSLEVFNLNSESFCSDTKTDPNTGVVSEKQIKELKNLLNTKKNTLNKNIEQLEKKLTEITFDVEKATVIQKLITNNKDKIKVINKHIRTLTETPSKKQKEVYRAAYTYVHNKGPPMDLPTQEGESIKTNQKSICKHRKGIPSFFPKGLYEAVVATKLPPVCFTMEEFMETFSAGTMRLFANIVTNGLHVDNVGNADKTRFYRNNPFYPKKRIRPLVTYPPEEADRNPRFRPLYNTVLVVADADNLNTINPDSMEFLMNIVRHEPTCEAHYFVSELQNNDTYFLTNMCDSLRLPEKKSKVDIEAYDIDSGKWTPVAVVQETGDRMMVRFKQAVVQTGRTRAFSIRPSLVRKWSKCDALSSPHLLRKFLTQHNIRVVTHIEKPRLQSIKQIQDEPSITESDKAAVSCALQEGRFGDIAHTFAVRLKLNHIVENLKKKNIHGKMLVVAADKCLKVYADTLKKGATDVRIMDLGKPNTWTTLKALASKKEETLLARMLVVVHKFTHWVQLSAFYPTKLKRRTAVYLVSQSAFERSGVPRTLGIRHVYLMGNDVRLAVLTQSGKVDGLRSGAPSSRFTVVTVWKYVVSSPEGDLESNHAANTEALGLHNDDMAVFSELEAWSGHSSDKPVFELEGPSGLGRVMDAMQFLRSVDEEEQRAFKGTQYTLHSKSGPTMASILARFTEANPTEFDPSDILAACKAWAVRVNLSPALYDRVVAAVQVILNGESYQAYVQTTQRVRCSNIRRQMAVQVALLQKIAREVEELAELTAYLSRSVDGVERFSGKEQLLVLTQPGGVVDMVRVPDSHSSLLAHMNAKQQMLDSARRSTVLELSRLWEKFRQCPHSARQPGPGTGRKISFIPVQNLPEKEKIYSDALSAAALFQQERGVETNGGQGRVLLFNDLASVIQPYSTGIKGGYILYAKKALQKGVASTLEQTAMNTAAKEVASTTLGQTAMNYGGKIINNALGVAAALTAVDVAKNLLWKDRYHQTKIKQLTEDIKKEKDPKERKKLEEERNQFYDANIKNRIEQENLIKVQKQKEKANLTIPQKSLATMPEDAFDQRYAMLSDKNLMGNGPGKDRHIKTLEYLSKGMRVELQPDIPPKFRFDPIVGKKAQLFMMHNIEQTRTMSKARANSYIKHLQYIAMRQKQEIAKKNSYNTIKNSIKDNYGRLLRGAVAFGLGLGLGPWGMLTYGVADLAMNYISSRKANKAKLTEVDRELEEQVAQRQSKQLLGGGNPESLLGILGESVLSGGLSTLDDAIVYVDPSRISLDKLTRLWEKGLSMAETNYPNGIAEIVTTSAPTYVQVLLEHSESCTQLDKSYVQGILKTKNFRCAKETNDRLIRKDKESESLGHDFIFVGKGGQSHTLLWNVGARVRVECSVLVAA